MINKIKPIDKARKAYIRPKNEEKEIQKKTVIGSIDPPPSIFHHPPSTAKSHCPISQLASPARLQGTSTTATASTFTHPRPQSIRFKAYFASVRTCNVPSPGPFPSAIQNPRNPKIHCFQRDITCLSIAEPAVERASTPHPPREQESTEAAGPAFASEVHPVLEGGAVGLLKNPFPTYKSSVKACRGGFLP